MGRYEVPIWEKMNLTVDEAVAYSGIGRDKLYEMLRNPKCPFALRNGRVTLIKRKEFEKYNSQVGNL